MAISLEECSITTEEAFDILLNQGLWSSDDVFGLLIYNSLRCLDVYLHDIDNEELNMFISLRGEIEEMMFNGTPYQEAIDEWYK